MGVFMVDSSSRLTKNIVQVPLHTLLYEKAKSRSVMDTVVAFEMALVVGKIITAALLIVIFSQVTALSVEWPVTWLVAAAAALLYLLI
jgi:hypothetical protein